MDDLMLQKGIRTENLDFEVALLVGVPECGEGVLAAENVLEQVFAAEVAVYDGVGEQLGDVAFRVAVRSCKIQ